MQGTDATIVDMSLDRGRDSGGSGWPLFTGAFVAAAVGCLAAYALHARQSAAPAVVKARTEAPPAPTVVEDPAKLYGDIIVEPEWRAAIAPPAEPTSTTLARLTLEAPAASAPSPVAVPPAPAPQPPKAETPFAAIPLPPIRDVPSVEDTAPLPPPRPTEFAESVAPPPATPDLRVAQPTAPADDRNIFQKLLGFGQQPGAVVASRPPATVTPSPAPARPTSTAALPPAAPPAAEPTTTVVSRSAAPGDHRGGGFGSLFGGPTSGPDLDRLGYDRQTAIYDISARTVYMPDGSRLEAHSGLGQALDDLRYVGERAVGPTPPHLYQLTMRESLFHGVQAIRLNPIGEGSLYGRAGLLAHPYMLGPNGDSNGCVSVKDYQAFLRAYQSGQIRKLAVVARL